MARRRRQGSLRQQLDNKKEPLSWSHRVRIAMSAARGLAYLHDLADPPVVHRDFKTSNILVASNYEVRIRPLLLHFSEPWISWCTKGFMRCLRKRLNPWSWTSAQCTGGYVT